ncbi:DHH family phosphoesterase [Psychromonas sp. MME2]|uniref:DHH family phosphoesterase n=1 Tax=Psychromonas sp. MME2 TaxID=3231033 RepID=UPI00339C8217
MIVLGHQNPDCDSLCSAIGLASLFNKLGKEATPALQGEPNPEALFLLEQSGLPQPEIRTSVAGEEIFIVDYSDWGQGTEDMKKATILGIVDHHKLGDITTSTPLECWIWPVGCSATIVYNMYKFHNQTPDATVAKMMMGAIISDTVNFQGPTTTDIDKIAAQNQLKLPVLMICKPLLKRNLKLNRISNLSLLQNSFYAIRKYLKWAVRSWRSVN